MKKFLLLLIVAVFAVGAAHAATYSGTAHATKMNGISIDYTAACSYTIDDQTGILTGSFSAGPHDVSMQSTQAITGAGTYNVSGTISLGGIPIRFSGTINVGTYNSTTLSFSCSAVALWFLVSEFTFNGTTN
jgi:hypothetical protein